MATDNSGIEWTDATWNPTRGCRRVSEGCRNCYAERVANRFSGEGQPYEGLVTDGRWNGSTRFVEEMLTAPLRWKKPRRIFVDSMSDLFYEGFTNEQIAAVFGVMALAYRHTFQVLTKRPRRMLDWFAWVAAGGNAAKAIQGNRDAFNAADAIAVEVGRVLAKLGWDAEEIECSLTNYMNGVGGWRDDDVGNAEMAKAYGKPRWPLPNVWLGVSVEDQAAADERIPLLLKVPARVRFLSCEPLLGPVDLRNVRHRLAGDSFEIGSVLDSDDGFGLNAERNAIDWVIAGCESGPGARPALSDWYRVLRDQCAAAGVAFFLKQAVPRDGEYTITNERPVPSVLGRVGELIPVIGVGRGSKDKGKVIGAPFLDGVQHLAFPEVRR